MTIRKKKIKKIKTFKTVKIRLDEINIIKSKLEEIELDERFPEIAELIKIMNNFVETGESNSGKMPLLNSNKDICYIFSNKLHIKSQVNLLVRK